MPSNRRCERGAIRVGISNGGHPSKLLLHLIMIVLGVHWWKYFCWPLMDRNIFTMPWSDYVVNVSQIKSHHSKRKGDFFLLYPFYRIVLTQARFFLCESLTYNWILMQVHTVTLYYYFTLKLKFVWNCMHGFLQDKMQTDSLIPQGFAAIKGSDTINRTSGSKIWRESGT